MAQTSETELNRILADIVLVRLAEVLRILWRCLNIIDAAKV